MSRCVCGGAGSVSDTDDRDGFEWQEVTCADCGRSWIRVIPA